MKHLGFASIEALNQYLRYANARRLNVDALLAESGLSEASRYMGEGRITGEQFQSFLTVLIQVADDPLLGLSSALYVRTQSYAILGRIAEQCDTLEQAIQRIPVFERLVGDMGTTQITRSAESISLNWNCSYNAARVIPHMVDNVLASWMLYAQWLTHSDARPRLVRLKKNAPDPPFHAAYQRIFQAPVEFACERDEIIIDASLLSLTPRQDGVLERQHLEGKARTEMAQLGMSGESFADQVKRSIAAHLQFGSARKDLLAEEFNCSERQIQRRLSKEGTSYRLLLDCARRERALRFIHETELSASEIAHNLGYEDERSFYRNFKRWTGKSPSSVRDQRA